MEIILTLFDAASKNPTISIGKIKMKLPEGKMISDVAKQYMREIYKGDPFIEEVVHDDGSKTRLCFTKTTNHFIGWKIKPQSKN